MPRFDIDLMDLPEGVALDAEGIGSGRWVARCHPSVHSVLAGLPTPVRDVLMLVCAGLTNCEISAQLGKSEPAISKRVSWLLEYFCLLERTHLAVYCQSGYMPPECKSAYERVHEARLVELVNTILQDRSRYRGQYPPHNVERTTQEMLRMQMEAYQQNLYTVDD